MAWLMRGKSKTKIKTALMKNIWNVHQEYMERTSFLTLFLTLTHLSKPFNRYCYHEFSVSACLSGFCEFWHSMITVLVKWEPLCFLQGRSCSGGTLLVTFLLLLTEKWLAVRAKSQTQVNKQNQNETNTPAVREPQCQSKQKTVNVHTCSLYKVTALSKIKMKTIALHIYGANPSPDMVKRRASLLKINIIILKREFKWN